MYKDLLLVHMHETSLFPTPAIFSIWVSRWFKVYTLEKLCGCCFFLESGKGIWEACTK